VFFTQTLNTARRRERVMAANPAPAKARASQNRNAQKFVRRELLGDAIMFTGTAMTIV
jgi:hypothetical protein